MGSTRWDPDPLARGRGQGDWAVPLLLPSCPRFPDLGVAAPGPVSAPSECGEGLGPTLHGRGPPRA